MFPHSNYSDEPLLLLSIPLCQWADSNLPNGIVPAYIIYMMIVICIAKAFLSFAEFAGSREKYLEDLTEKQQKAAEKKAEKIQNEG